MVKQTKEHTKLLVSKIIVKPICTYSITSFVTCKSAIMNLKCLEGHRSKAFTFEAEESWWSFRSLNQQKYEQQGKQVRAQNSLAEAQTEVLCKEIKGPETENHTSCLFSFVSKVKVTAGVDMCLCSGASDSCSGPLSSWTCLESLLSFGVVGKRRPFVDFALEGWNKQEMGLRERNKEFIQPATNMQ